jgi:aminoglycoside phosphotransferase (APT) family kinase protein
VDPLAIAERHAAGGRVQRLAGGGRALHANEVFRLWRDEGPVILKLYGTDARARREMHALEALGTQDGLPVILEQGKDGDRVWTVFADAGSWSLATLPDNPGLARKAGGLLRRVHEAKPEAMSNLSHGIDEEWIAVDFVSTFRRLERYRGKLHIPAATLEAARATRPPSGGEPKAAHANPKPSRFIVDDLGVVTLINWEWATLAPPEWDLTRLGWLLRLEAGEEASKALLEGYGSTVDQVQLARWAVYHTGMMLVSEAEETVRSGGADFDSLASQLDLAISAANAE